MPKPRQPYSHGQQYRQQRHPKARSIHPIPLAGYHNGYFVPPAVSPTRPWLLFKLPRPAAVQALALLVQARSSLEFWLQFQLKQLIVQLWRRGN